MVREKVEETKKITIKIKNMAMQTTIKNKAILYCRVSSREQEDTGYSLDAQEKSLKEYADKKELKIDKIYKISESASGKQIRKTFNEMLNYAEKNKVSIILCEKIDRLTRNLRDAAIVNDWLLADKERAVHFVKENFIVNQNTKAHENLVWDMKVAIARFYTNNLGEEVKKGQKEKIAQGQLPTKPPLGYKTIGDKGHKIHIPDEALAPLVKKMFELYSSGNYSLKALIEVMHREGLRSRDGNRVSKSRIHKYLSDPFYYGKMRWKNEIYNGDHEPLITQDLFDMVQGKLTRQLKAPQFKTHHPVFKAKVMCEECGGTISWYMTKGHWYGNCNHYKKCSQHGCVRQERVEEQLFPYFDTIAPKNSRILQWLEKALKESHADEITYNERKKGKYNQIIGVADRRIEMAYRDKLDGRMPSELCEKVMNEAMKDKDDAQRALVRLSSGRREYYEAGYAIHELACKAKEIYMSPKATIEDKRLLLSYVFSNLTLNADKIRPNYTFAFDFLTNWMPKVNCTFEPAEMATNKRKSAALGDASSVLLRG